MAHLSSLESIPNSGRQCQILQLGRIGIRKPKQRKASKSKRIVLKNPTIIIHLAKHLGTIEPASAALSPSFWAVLFNALSTNTLNPPLLAQSPDQPKTPSVSAPSTNLPPPLHPPAYTLLTQNAFFPTSVSFYPPYPFDPTIRLPTDPPCYLCHLPTCNCHPFTSSLILHPHIHHPHIHLTHYGPKGWGARTLQTLPPGAILDEYVGEILPYYSGVYPSTYSVALALPRCGRGRGWGVEGGTLLQLCAEKKGNWTRFVNHSCDPNCRFEIMVVGRRWRVMLVVGREVGKGEEVTVGYGGSYWRGGGRGRCLCGEEGCPWGEGVLGDDEEGWVR